MSHRKGRQGPTASSAQLFGEELRYARENAGLRQEDLSRLLHCDRTVITRVESGQRRLQPDMVEKVDELLRSNGLLVRLYERVDWHAQYEHPDWFQKYVELEAEAVAVRVFQDVRMNGLLQGEAYARAVFSLGNARGNPQLIEERVTARLSRQPRFFQLGGPSLYVVLTEAVIRTSVGDARVMRMQMEHLLRAGSLPNITIQVLPFDRGETPVPAAPTMMLEMPDGKEWLYSESLDRGYLTDAPSIVSENRRIYDTLRADVLSARESRELIVGALEEYRDAEYRARNGAVAQEQLQRRERRRVHRGGPRIPRPRPRA